ncbi:transposase [Streptomyces phaeofaciens]|uniref:transposase n=1 Tax=Streptomyces phaeofaciens TaxID=68254 RepID=UPI00167C4278
MHYSTEFKADAVALYRSRPGATVRSVAADLGVHPEMLRNWVQAARAGRPGGCRAETPAEPPCREGSTRDGTPSAGAPGRATGSDGNSSGGPS